MYLCVICKEVLATNEEPCKGCGSEQIIPEPDYEWHENKKYYFQ